MLALAVDRERLAREAAALLARIDTLTQSRLAAGDIAELEARAAHVDAARAALDVERARARRRDRAWRGCCSWSAGPPISRR